MHTVSWNKLQFGARQQSIIYMEVKVFWGKLEGVNYDWLCRKQIMEQFSCRIKLEGGATPKIMGLGQGRSQVQPCIFGMSLDFAHGLYST